MEGDRDNFFMIDFFIFWFTISFHETWEHVNQMKKTGIFFSVLNSRVFSFGHNTTYIPCKMGDSLC